MPALNRTCVVARSITESLYYLPNIGVPPAPPFDQLRSPFPVPNTDELIRTLQESHRHVTNAIHRLSPDVVRRSAGAGTWTSRKVLRRLAWHERDETRVVRRLLLVV